MAFCSAANADIRVKIVVPIPGRRLGGRVIMPKCIRGWADFQKIQGNDLKFEHLHPNHSFLMFVSEQNFLSLSIRSTEPAFKK
jgi:hypothetical protein